MCYLRVAAEETPVDVGTVPDVRVVVLGGSGLENLLDELLGLRLVRLLEEELDNGGKDLELGLRAFVSEFRRKESDSSAAYLGEFLHETVNESSENITGVTYLLSIFANDPYQ